MTAAFDLSRFHALLETRTFGRNLIFEPSVGSTMDVARDSARRGAPAGTLVVADEQTAGRGRLGRSWVTPPGSNLASTLVLRPRASLLREVAMMAPLAICHAVQDMAGIRPAIKWPNDVIIGEKKVAGVLIESDLDGPEAPWVLVGAGINVNFDPREYEEIREIATSLRVETGHEGDREALLASYVHDFERLYRAAEEGESPFENWRERLATVGRHVRAQWGGGAAEGVAEDVTEDGALVVRTADGEAIIVEAGDVTLRA
ncbi:MAG TPA: biotin--[acetyl-CoA-carboxylase] ligase [Dehalococcoidia bacterium]|nr:biotin--[acetyl-CoA-carboxylase] ligase [Dehalococcoidia bacterium]